MADTRQSFADTNILAQRAGGIHAPPEVIATWPTPNYINPEERDWGAPIALAIMLGVTLLVYIARMWSRLTMTKSAGIDDILMSVAILPVIGLTISAMLAVKYYGFQWHMWDQTPSTKTTYTDITMAIELCYMVSTTLIKISILFFYRRLTGSLTNRFVYCVWACIAFCVSYFVAFVFAIFFTCSPTNRQNNCSEEGIILVTVTAVSTVQDLIICFLPVFLIKNLQMPKRQKLALYGIFGLGIITSVCGIMRLYYVTYVYYFTYDVTWYAYYGWIWTVLEADLGVICASAPALRRFFRQSLDFITSHTGNSRSRGHQTPIGALSTRGDCSTQPSKNKKGADVESCGDQIPMNIMIERDLRISSQGRDDLSQRSDSSTKKLTAIIRGPL